MSMSVRTRSQPGRVAPPTDGVAGDVDTDLDYQFDAIARS
jgi:hypothetical protein